MAYCCVPTCNSKFIKGSDISFHEIPSDFNLRIKWLNAIPRKNWIPNLTSNYSRVCSKHFQECDFNPWANKKRLLKTAVPTLFLNDSEHEQHPTKKLKSTADNSEHEQDPTKKLKLIADVGKQSRSSQITKLGIFSGIIKQEIEVSNTDAMRDNWESKYHDKSVQADFLNKEKKKEINYLKVKTRKALERMKVLQKKYDDAREKVLEYEGNKYMKSVKKIIDKADENDVSAKFILNVIKNFTSKRPVYDDTTIQECLMWRAISAKGYEYARKNLMVQLPSRLTLSRIIGMD